MRTGRREIETGKRKLNIFKVFIVLLLIVLVIVVVYFSFNKDNKDTTNEEYNKKIDEALVEDIQEEKSKTIDDIVSEFGGEIKEQVKNDTYYITKDGKDYTAYLDGEVVEGKIVPWNGTAVQPSIDEAGNINIYTAEELKWLADQVITGQKEF